MKRFVWFSLFALLASPVMTVAQPAATAPVTTEPAAQPANRPQAAVAEAVDDGRAAAKLADAALAQLGAGSLAPASRPFARPKPLAPTTPS